MLENDEVVKKGIALYDGTTPYNVKIQKSPILYGTGDYDDPPEIRNDRELACFYVWYESPGPPGPEGPYRSGGSAFETLEAAMKKVEEATSMTVKWVDGS